MADERAQGTDPFDVQLAELQRQLSGGGQGGIGSDARMPVAPVVRDPRTERLIQLRAMRGLDPTPEQDAYLRAIRPEKEARGDRLAAAGAELSGIPQIGRAGTAIGKAIAEPSIPTVTNAAVQTSLAALRPAVALKSLGLGYGAAVADDLGAFNWGAEAQSAKKGATAKTPMPGLTPEMQAEYDAAQKRLADGDFSGSAERRQVEKTVEDFRRASIEYQSRNADAVRQQQANQKAADLAEYNRRVGVAEASKQREMDRDVRFQDTTTGKVYKETAGVTPFLASAGLSGLNRAATGKVFGKENVLAPLAVGAGEGIAAANLPLASDAYLVTPPLNPEREAYRVYARDLPSGHPDKESAATYAQGLPEENPVRTLAAKELYDPLKLAERSGIGLVEGLLGQYAGPKVPQLAGRMYEGAKNVLGRFLGAGGPTPSATTSGLAADTPVAASALSPTSIVGGSSSGSTLPALATERNALAGPERLADRIKANPVPEPARPSNQRGDLPEWASEPPEGVRLKPGQNWHTEMQRIKNADGTFADMPKYSAPRVRKEVRPRPSESNDTPEVRGVQIDDMRPLRYRNKLDPDE